MKFINSQSDLQPYVRNTVTTVQGEPTLFEKISPSLNIAEGFLAANFIDAEFVNEQIQDATSLDADPADCYSLQDNCKAFVAAYAMQWAVPQLDLILTPNGFGIVSNQNVAPASADRVNRLINNYRLKADYALSAIFEQVFYRNTWHATKWGKVYGKSLINPKLWIDCDALRNDSNSAADYPVFFDRVSFIEKQFVDEFLSVPVWEHILTETAKGFNAYPNIVRPFRHMLQYAATHQGKEQEAKDQIFSLGAHLVELIADNQDLLRLWSASDTAKLFHEANYKNTRSAGGFWF